MAALLLLAAALACSGIAGALLGTALAKRVSRACARARGKGPALEEALEDPLLLFVLLSLSRYIYRRVSQGRHVLEHPVAKKRTLVIGAGTAGAMAIREFDDNPASRNTAVCLIDDVSFCAEP